MSKQTSTEWLFKKLWDEPKDKLTWYAILEKAEEMHQQDIIEAVSFGDCRGRITTYLSDKDYYKETFNK